MRASTFFSVLYLLLLKTPDAYPIPYPLITKYLKIRNVLSVLYYSCKSDEYIFSKIMNDNSIPVMVVKSAEMNSLVLHSKNGILVDLSCYYVPDLLNFAVENYLFREIISWIFINNQDDENLDILLETYIPLSSDVSLFSKSSLNDSESWTIYDLYAVSKKSNTVITPIVTSTDTEMILEPVAVYRKSKSLNGMKIRATIAFHYPERITRVDDLGQKHIDTATKVCYQVMMNLAMDLNFTYDLSQSDSYGYIQNGSFRGAMGHFERKEIEVGILSAFLREDRMKIVEYVTETFIITSPLMFRQPSLASVSNIFTLPFGLDVWWSFVALTVILIISQLLLIASPMMRNELAWLDSLSFVLGAICQQGFNRDNFLFSGRILHFVTFLSCLFFFSSYSANIVALLQSPSNALKSMTDVTRSNLKVLVQNNEYNHILYPESTDPEVIELYMKKIKPFGEKVYEIPEEGVKKIRTGKYAFQLETHTAYKIISDTYTETEKCGLKEVESIKIPRHSIPIVKNSSYRSIFRERLTWQREVGLYEATFKRWINQKFKCEGNVGEFHSVGIQECRHAFMIVAFGSILAVIFFLIEIAQKRIQKELKNVAKTSRKVKPKRFFN
uniref:Ionotropic glutamate receptor C-terminal domain-containing protein n=1 Tax=Phlebotomus papatasi TaxID=29031 RepID=A0A8W9ARP3_PHLPP